MLRDGALLVVGSNPPSQTSGQRTLGRVEQARVILGFADVRLANLFAFPSYRSGGISELGASPEGWLEAREHLTSALEGAAGILLAYGIQPPTGPAREHFRAQVAWLNEQIDVFALPCWWVGGAPRHPSRWQRYTWRAFPDQPYASALECAIGRRT